MTLSTDPTIWLRRSLWAAALAVLGLATTAAILLGRPGAAVRSADPTPPLLGRVPDFELTERSGKTVSRAQLAGRPWIAGFIFTRCGGICPALSTKMARLQQELGPIGGEPIQMVSISVDPTHDTPAVLSEYARRFGADPHRWLFLTGPRPEVYRLVHDGFKLMMVELTPEQQNAGDEPIAHSDRLVLVDGALRIRGYYRGSEQHVLEQLRRDLAALMQASASSGDRRRAG